MEDGFLGHNINKNLIMALKLMADGKLNKYLIKNQAYCFISSPVDKNGQGMRLVEY